MWYISSKREMDAKCLKCLGQHQSQTPRQGQGQSDGPMARGMRWLLESRSLAGPNAGRSGRTPLPFTLGTWRTLAELWSCPACLLLLFRDKVLLAHLL